MELTSHGALVALVGNPSSPRKEVAGRTGLPQLVSTGETSNARDNGAYTATRSSVRYPVFARAETALMEELAQPTRRAPNPKTPTRPDTSPPASIVDGQEQASPATRLRERQIDSDGDDSDNEPPIKRARLTRKNLALFDSIGKKKVCSSGVHGRVINDEDHLNSNVWVCYAGPEE